MDKLTTASNSSFGLDFINDLSAVTKDENAIVEILLCRMERRKIYTWVGPLLLALNPGKHYDDLYDESWRKSFGEDNGNTLKKSTPPHIYAVANRARYRLVNGLGKINQVIVISGESGTGKTFNARKALDFLAAKNDKSRISGIVDQAAAESCQRIIHKIGNVIPLVSAFSTARTPRNARSSRHGQLLRLEYEKNGVIRGARVHSFLLERTRVTECSDNFEIFYQLIYGLSDQAIDEFRLSRFENYAILGDCNSRDARSFAYEFRETVESLESLGFTEQSRVDIFRVVAFLVHMGNIRFKKKTGEGCTIDFSNEESRNALINSCSLISLPEHELTELLTTTLICPQSSRGRHTSYRRELKTPEDCRNRLFSITRFIYDSLFNWLVERVNETLSANCDSYDWLGILDIFGFESFDQNGLEQLCINYATERLQLYFMEDYLEAGQRELEEEGLDKLPPSLTIQLYRDRLFVIEAIVFSTFNDASQSPIPPKSSTLRHQLLLKQKKYSGFLSIKNDVFVIEHYSCPVEYSVNNLLSKNTDKVPTELSSAFGKCKNKLLLLLLEIEQGNPHGSRVSLKKCTALAKLKLSLDCLVKELNKCDTHYVRCAKPRHSNNSWAKIEFREQLAGTGIFDALPLARCKLPVKFRYDEFYKRYSFKQTDSNSNLLRDLGSIVDSKDLTNSFHLGKNLLFFTEAIFFDLENYRKNHRSRCVKKIQSFWMRVRQRRRAKDRAKSPMIKVNESTIITRKVSKFAQRDRENEKCSREEIDEQRKNVTGFEKKIFQVYRVPSADTGYSSTMTVGDESQQAESKSQRPSDISTSPSREELPINVKNVETEKLGSFSGIDVWKDLYVRNWLNLNPTEIKYSRKAELPRDSTFIVNLAKFSLFYRNRILSRRRPVEIPIKFHTRITCLAHSHCLPNSLRPRGLEDCLSETINSVLQF